MEKRNRIIIIVAINARAANIAVITVCFVLEFI